MARGLGGSAGFEAVSQLGMRDDLPCGEAGLVRVGEIAVDGPRMRANASRDRNRGYESIVSEILQEAERVDREEDERYGEARGDELPEQLRTREGRREALKAGRERLERERAEAQQAGEEVIAEVELDLDRDQFPAALDGRVQWLRQGRRELEAQRAQNPWPVPRSRSERLLEAQRRMDEELAFEHAANRAYEHYRQTGRRSAEHPGLQRAGGRDRAADHHLRGDHHPVPGLRAA